MSAHSKIIGIDLGTTNSVSAVVLGSEPEVIPNSEGTNKTPSVVAFMEDGSVVVGEIARRQAATNPNRTISSVKRLIGRTFDEVAETDEIYPYQLVDHDNELLIDVDGMGYRPEQISALIIKKLKESAEAYLEDEVNQAVITVPAYFDDMQRQATIDAAQMAGLEVLRLINEPTAAAMAYGLGRASQSDEIVAIYDFGGGTFDISILEISEKTFEVLTSTGDTYLGGDDLDDCIVRMISEDFKQQHGIDLTGDPVIVRRLKEVAERAKCELSATQESRLSLPFLCEHNGQHLHLDFVLTRLDFEDLIEEHVRRSIRCCKQALEEANLGKKDINKVILVGGTTRIPFVQDSVEDFFDQAAFRGVNPDEVVAMGAATQAGIFEGVMQEVVLLDVTPHSLGIEVEGGKFSQIIEKNSTIPIRAAKTFTTTEDNQAFVNIHVLQGESNEAAENKSLGKFSVTEIPQAKAGVPRVRVTFFINADGVMEISAEEMSSGKAEVITIVHSKLSEEENDRRSKRRVRSRERQKRDRRSNKASGTISVPSPRKTNDASSPRRRSGSRNIDSSQISNPLSSGRRSSVTPARGALDDSDVRSSTNSEPNVRPEFAVLGDTDPSEQAAGIKPRDMSEISLNPVDYSKSPPMYSRFDESPAETPKSSEPQTDKPKSKQSETKEDTSYVIEKKKDELPEYNSRIRETGTQEPMVTPLPINASVDEDSDQEITSETELSSYSGRDIELEETRLETDFRGQDDITSEESIESLSTITLPDDVKAAVTQAIAGDDSKSAQKNYANAIKSLGEEKFQRSRNWEVLTSLLALHSMAGQLEETKETLGLLQKHHSDSHQDELISLHENTIERFGSPAQLQRIAASMYEKAGNLTEACSKLERAMKAEPQKSDEEDLMRLYGIRSQNGDPTAKFKLVKILLKSNRVDEAIDILQVLQDDDQFRSRALKVLGLCYWQKNMHYLAWQKFKSLSIDDDLKDILYRLAGDMEAADQLSNAVSVLEHLVESAKGYRDSESRLKKLQYRLKLQKEEFESHRDIPLLSKDSRFTILEEINRGSMGIIFKANDKTLNDIVALKMLNDYLCSDPSAVERFKSEARAAKKLSHPYIVRIHDLFEIENKRFISMEYIDGIDLKRMILERTTFTQDMILYYFRQICDALSYAHRMGIIHRDIKPANIMITSDNQVKITDFGIAKILRGDEITKSGTAVIGTPLYMAPEQIIGDPVDARTDIYSLGIMLYEIVNGNPPFYLGNIEYHHIHTAPPTLPESVPERIRETVMKMIAKDPSDRFQKIEDILEFLLK